MSKEFNRKLDKETSEAKLAPLREILEEAKRRANTRSGRSFVIACEKFFKQNHHLTENQITALENIDHDHTPHSWDADIGGEDLLDELDFG